MGALALLLFLLLTLLSPLLFGELMLASLQKLHLSPSGALTAMIAMVVGGLINIPVTRIRRDKSVSSNPLAVYGLADFWPQAGRTTHETVIAVNFGGCVVPVGLALYEIAYLAAINPRALMLCMGGCLVNIAVCYRVARPVAGVGITMPGLVSPAIAALLAFLLAPDAAPPVAFVIGVLGPLIGADLLHLKDVEAAETGMASIGGAGTFDGIVLSGVIAAYLA
jgi:uncharacterized membrane protein